MPIPVNQIRVVEIIMKGQMAAGGSNSKFLDWPFHFRRTAVSITPSKTSVETAFNTNICAPILLALQADYAQLSNSVRWVNDAEDAPLYISRAGVGAIVTDRQPAEVAVFILARTALKGRSYKGGKHLAPIAESATTLGASDVLNAGAVTLFNAVAAAMLAGFTDADGNTWKYCIMSRKAPAVLKTNPTNVITNDVIQTSVNRRLGSMTHRKPRSIY